MKEKLFFISLILAITLVSNVYAEDQIPKVVLDQWTLDPGYYTSEDDSCSMNAYVSYCHSPDKRLADWRLSSKEEAQTIAESFIKNSEDKLNISFDDLEIREVIFSADPTYDHYNPSATIWYEQYYDGIPTGSELSVSINAYGTIWSVKNRLTTGITAPTTPIITSDEAIRIAKERYNQARFELEKDPELVIYENKLVWRLNIFAPISKEVMIDSQNGEIVLERNNFVSEGNDAIPINQKHANIYYYIIPIIGVLAIIAYFILKKKK